jgi:hypothetical protein
MQNMSFMLTTEQVEQQTKLVTRRMGWLLLRAGDVLQPVERCMGIPKGGSIVRIGGPIMVTSVRREPLLSMSVDRAYGVEECALEGFPELTPYEFIEMFCKSHRGCTPASEVTRISFKYLPKQLALPFEAVQPADKAELGRLGVWSDIRQQYTVEFQGEQRNAH